MSLADFTGATCGRKMTDAGNRISSPAGPKKDAVKKIGLPIL
jgi:hypothetical protein